MLSAITHVAVSISGPIRGSVLRGRERMSNLSDTDAASLPLKQLVQAPHQNLPTKAARQHLSLSAQDQPCPPAATVFCDASFGLPFRLAALLTPNLPGLWSHVNPCWAVRYLPNCPTCHPPGCASLRLLPCDSVVHRSLI